MQKKKSQSANLESKRLRFLQIGLVVSLALTVAAFEWTTFDYKEQYTEIGETIESDPIPDIPEYVEPQPDQPKPKPNVFKMGMDIKQVDDKKSDVVSKDLTVTTKQTEELDLSGLDDLDRIGDATEEKHETKVYDLSEVGKMPEFNGSMGKWLSNNIKYPAMAREEGFQETVYVQFVIDTDGTIKDAKVLKEVGFGLDKEALRVVRKMPKWTPATQLGYKVPVRMVLPIRFTLQ